MNRIYLDHAATTPARREVIDAMVPLLGDGGYNPSSLHAEGRAARAALDAARDTVAAVLGARPREIVFTGSGSESDVLAIVGAARARSSHGRHIVSSAIEHHAVLHALDVLEAEGWSVTRLAVTPDGLVEPDAFAAALRPDTTLATVMLANNEIGTVQPIAQLASIARARNVLFHTDAVQAPGQLALDVRALGVDLLSISGHKFYGPKGVGALFVREGTALEPLVVGGPQEHGLRAGTENVAGIAGFSTALALAEHERAATAARIGGLRDRLERGIRAAVPDTVINGAAVQRLRNNCSVAFAGTRADALLIALDLAGIAASSGSACAAGSLEPSHVAAALGLPEAYRRGVIRFSLGRTTTPRDIDRVVAVVPGLVAQVRGAVAAV
ncbi:MAG: cysteine desulfurase family protein [Candidatus Velthaea sp.]